MKKFLESIVERAWLAGDPSKDRTVGLVVFGALEILRGIFCFTLAMLLLIVVSTNGLHGIKPIHYWMSMGVLFHLTGWFIVMGMGSIKARRWARALLLVGAWVSIFFGTLVLALILYILPEIYSLLADSGLLPPMGALKILYFVVLVLLLLQVVFPLVSIVFYGLKGVEATCERRNPEPCWTDRCPLPLLAMSIISITGCFSIVFAGTTNYTVFFYGHVLNGVPGALIVAFISVACGYVGWGAYTRKMHAWWGAYALIVLVSSSMMLSFSEMDVAAMYDLMGYSEEQSAHLRGFYSLSSATLTFISCAWGIMTCIYLVWVRDRFLPEVDEAEVKSYQQRKAEEEAAAPKEPPRARMRLN